MTHSLSLLEVGARRSWRWSLIVLATVLALLTVPTAGSSQIGAVETLRMDVTADGVSFTHTPDAGAPVTQPAVTATRCELDVDGPLAALDGNRRGPGLSDNGVGIKSGGAQGTPCGRVDGTELLTVGLVGVPAAVSAELDLELKGDTRLLIETRSDGVLVDTFDLRAGGSIVAGEGVDGTMTEPFGLEVTSDEPVGNCRNASDAGPDAGSRDNCRVTIVPSSPFDEVTLTPTAGEVSLEGGGDFGTDPSFDTIFHLVAYDGELDCGDEVTEVDGTVEGTIARYENTDGDTCVPKPYTLVVSATDPTQDGDETVTFEVDDPASQAAIHLATLTFDQALTTPLSAVLQYDSDGSDGYDDFKHAEACVEDPFDLADDPAGSLNDEAIPDGHEACVVEVTQNWDGSTTWTAVFEGDWLWK